MDLKAAGDHQLLAEHLAGRSDQALEELIRRHAPLIRSTCLRFLADEHAADDAVQAVFLLLARKAGSLRGVRSLAGWLFLATGHVCRDLRREARRRQRHEEAAAMDRSRRGPAAAAAADWEWLSPRLDAALAALPGAQREAVLLRYFQGRSVEEIAQATNCPRTTAAMRVSGGVERLRRTLAGPGGALGAAALAGLLESHAPAALPAAAVSKIAAACLGQVSASAVAVSAMKGAAQAMLWVKVKLAAAVLGAAVVLGGGGAAAVKLAMDRPAPASVQAAPAWVMDLAPGTWAAVSRNTPADVDPAKNPGLNPNHPDRPPWAANMGQVAVTAAWNGGALATRWGAKGALLIYGGGGGNYFGNEVYAFDLEARLWSRVTDPWRGPCRFDDAETYPEGRFADGSPTVTSTYDQEEYHPGLNSFITFTAAKSARGGYNVATAHLLSLDSRKWRHSPRNEKNHANVGGWSAYDGRRDVFWVEGGAGSDTFARFDPKAANPDGTAGRWTNYELKLNGSMDAVAACDPVRDLVVIANFRDDSSTEALRGVCAIDLKSPESPAVRLRDEGARPAIGGKAGAAGWEWSHLRGAFLCWRRGADVLEFRPPAGDWKTGAWTWSVLTDAAANRAEPEKMQWDNGVYSRFRIARYADAEVAVVINNMGGPVWAFRIPEPAKARQPGKQP